MKTRNGFVSNSSSSSFVLPKSAITAQQYDDLQEFCIIPVGEWGDSWDINSDRDTVSGFTCMNNSGSDVGGLEDWMKKNNFPMNIIEWEHD